MRNKSTRTKIGPLQKKILLLLSAGVGLSVARTSKQMLRVLEAVGQEWSKVNRQSLDVAIKGLYRSKLVEWKENNDGTITVAVSDKGRRKSLTYDFENMTIRKPSRWDGKWRVVLFDVPEKRKSARNALREALKRLGFFEYQKSVFVHPYDCRDEFDYIVELFSLRPHARFMVAAEVDNALHLKRHFGLV